MRRLKMLVMSAVLTVAMLVALSGPAMAHSCCIDDFLVGDRFDGIDDGRLLFLIDEDEDDCDFDGARRIDDVTLVFLDCD